MSLAEGRLVFIHKTESAPFLLTHPMSLQRDQLSIKLFHANNLWLLTIFSFWSIDHRQKPAGFYSDQWNRLSINFGSLLPYLGQELISLITSKGSCPAV